MVGINNNSKVVFFFFFLGVLINWLLLSGINIIKMKFITRPFQRHLVWALLRSFAYNSINWTWIKLKWHIAHFNQLTLFCFCNILLVLSPIWACELSNRRELNYLQHEPEISSIRQSDFLGKKRCQIASRLQSNLVKDWSKMVFWSF